MDNISNTVLTYTCTTTIKPFYKTIMNIKKFIDSYLNHYVSFQAGAIGSINRGAHDLERFRRTRPGDSFSKKDSKILIAVPSHAVKGPDMQEVSHAYRAFTKARYDVDFVTADGSPVQFSQSDLTDPVNRWFVEDANAKYSAEQPLKAEDIEPSRYVAVYFAGGNAILSENHWVQTLAEQILKKGGVIAGSGNAEEAVQNLNLTDYINTGYSLPKAGDRKSVSEYGSSATETMTISNGWTIHDRELTLLETTDISESGRRMVALLAA